MTQGERKFLSISALSWRRFREKEYSTLLVEKDKGVCTKDLILPGRVIFLDKDLKGASSEDFEDSDVDEVQRIMGPHFEQIVELINDYKKRHPEEKF